MSFLTWLDSRHFVSNRAATLFVTLWMTWEAFAWAKGYAYATTLDGVSAAAVIAAVTAPISALQAAVFAFYMGAKK